MGQSVTQLGNDKEQIMPMVEVIERKNGQTTAAILADHSYCSEKNLAYLETAIQSGPPIEAYIAHGKVKHDEYRQPCPRAALPENATGVARIEVWGSRSSFQC
jgi:hypothetical protein